jgi:hypothetical protein
MLFIKQGSMRSWRLRGSIVSLRDPEQSDGTAGAFEDARKVAGPKKSKAIGGGIAAPDDGSFLKYRP